MGFTTFALWKPPFRFVFASLGESSNGLTLRYDPETRLFAYVICFAATATQAGDDNPNSPSAYGAVMEALVATGLPEEAINVQALDPDLLSSKWTYYELVLRIFHFQNQTEGNLYLQSHNHNHPFYYVSAAGNNPRRNNTSNNDDDDDDDDDTATFVSSRGEQHSTVPKQWSVPSRPTGFKSPFHPKSINEKELLAPSFLHYGRQVLSDLHRIFSTSNDVLESRTTDNSIVNNNISSNAYINYTNHSFGPLYVAEGSDCLRHDTECLGGCPDAAYFGLNIVDDGGGNQNHNSSSSFFETLPSWPTPHELHVVTVVDHRALNNSVYGSLALLGSSSEILDPKHLTRSVRATSVGVTSVELFGGAGETNHKTNADADSENPGENTDKMPLSPSVFATWVFTRNPDHCRILSISRSSPAPLQHLRRYGCTVIDSGRLSISNKYVTYLERIYLNPLTGTRPDYENILPARLYRVVLEDPNKERNSYINQKDEPSSLETRSNEKEDTASENNNPHNNLPFSKIRLPPSQNVVTFDGDEPLRFLHIIKTGGESLEKYIWKEQSLRIDYSACLAAATKATNSSFFPSSSSSQQHQKTTAATAAKTSFPFSATKEVLRGTVCNALATITSSALCGLNCECCASDLLKGSNSNIKRKAFHGTMLRSPRAHVLSQFSHCHNAHHSSWRRILGDISLYAAEGILRLTEEACKSSCDAEGDNDWFRALQKRLDTDEREILPYYHNFDGLNTGGDDGTYVSSSESSSNNTDDRNDRVLVISIHNTQSHALTCGKSKGSFGHHFRRIARSSAGDENDSANVNATSIDYYTPSLQDALEALDRFEWFGITELFVPSLCLLHYQSNGGTKQQLPPQCDCDSPAFVEHDQPGSMGYWKETRSKKRSVEDLTEQMLQQIDDHTKVDVALYSQAVRIFLGKLQSVEKATGTSLLKCIQWGKFRAKTGYLTELWSTGPNGLLV
jgi:hypothetical protein